MFVRMLQLGMMGVNCYIVGSETTGKGIVVDPGDEAETILATIKEEKLDIGLIVITHAHGDHIMALTKVKNATGAKFAAHPLEVPALSNVHPMMNSFFGPMDPIPTPDILLNDGDKVSVDGVELTVIHTPGHSPGGICLLGDGFVLSGDTLFAMGVGRVDLSGGQWELLLESIRTRLFVLPDDTEVGPGHGPATRIGYEKVNNPFVGSEAGHH